MTDTYGISVDRESLELTVGQTEVVKATLTKNSQTVTSSAVEWTSSDEKVASVKVSDDDKQKVEITGQSNGTATITATYQGQKATVEVTVADNKVVLKEVVVTTAKAEVISGDSITFSVTGKGTDDKDFDLKDAEITWEVVSGASIVDKTVGTGKDFTLKTKGADKVKVKVTVTVGNVTKEDESDVVTVKEEKPEGSTISFETVDKGSLGDDERVVVSDITWAAVRIKMVDSASGSALNAIAEQTFKNTVEQGEENTYILRNAVTSGSAIVGVVKVTSDQDIENVEGVLVRTTLKGKKNERILVIGVEKDKSLELTIDGKKFVIKFEDLVELQTLLKA